MTLKEIRISKNYSQNDASNFLHIPLRTYKRYESDPHYINKDIYVAISKKLLLASPKINSSSERSNVLVVGMGVVGTSLGTLLSKKHKVSFYDINKNKVDEFNLNRTTNRIKAFYNEECFKQKEIIFICINTNLNLVSNRLDTSSFDSIMELIKKYSPKSTVVIRSTVPIGFCDSLAKKYKKNDIIFIPEFIKESSAVSDEFSPSRIIIGTKNGEKNLEIAGIFKELLRNSPPIYFMNYKEAEAVKLFSNSYLAMRVAYFNELDSFASLNGLNASKIIQGVCGDERIGDYYNNPSFGYGGSCLVKDNIELASYLGENSLSNSVNKSNERRIRMILGDIIKNIKPYSIIGCYFTKPLNKNDVLLKVKYYFEEMGFRVLESTNFESIDLFASRCDLILANRIDQDIIPYLNKIYTRDMNYIGKKCK